VRYQNICSALFSFVTKHACDRRTGRITIRKTALAASRGKTIRWDSVERCCEMLSHVVIDKDATIQSADSSTGVIPVDNEARIFVWACHRCEVHATRQCTQLTTDGLVQLSLSVLLKELLYTHYQSSTATTRWLYILLSRQTDRQTDR